MPRHAFPEHSDAALLDLQSRGEIKRAGTWLDLAGRPRRAGLAALARSRGAEVPEEWETMDGARLLKALLARGEAAQVVSNPVHVDESFVCAHCGADVPPGGRRPRDHCPRCLHSLHVDIVPGDRAADCGGLLVPVSAGSSPKGWMIAYRCQKCGASRRNRFLDDLAIPDEQAPLRALVSRGGMPGSRHSV